MEMEPRVFGQPGPDDRMFVRAVVVADQMNFPAPVLSVEDLQEGQELLVRVPAEASFGDRAGGHLQSSEQTRGAVPDVVMRHSGWKARTNRQDRGCPEFCVSEDEGRWVLPEGGDLGDTGRGIEGAFGGVQEAGGFAGA